ncbi:hypothetical protein [Paractinoplanes toevensis]|uniref:Uncharacterized protein n=1 Tax=Paractinoplanes toevensis TaxID=571911 RepID=A0A919T3T6_9ACTN|nr:hypothetical protein [Actinoplanes toevensis]GIM88839.1 hypothetical protein Ato02nite_006320 [Actinoplanes toevensis]
MQNFRKKPVKVAAVQWTGSNAAELAEFTNGQFQVLDEADRANCDDPEATAQVFDVLHSTWVLVYDGDWIPRGVRGEHYPVRESVFHETYETAGDQDLPAGVFLARKHPVEIPALVWTGDNAGELQAFTGGLFRVDQAGAQVFGKLRNQWQPVSVGDVVVRGLLGEFYAVEGESFPSTYAVLDEAA